MDITINNIKLLLCSALTLFLTGCDCIDEEQKLLSAVSSTVWQIDDMAKADPSTNANSAGFKRKDLFLVRLDDAGKIQPLIYNKLGKEAAFVDFQSTQNISHKVDTSNQLVHIQMCFTLDKSNTEYFGKFQFSLKGKNATFKFEILDTKDNHCPDKLIKTVEPLGEEYGTGTGH